MIGGCESNHVALHVVVIVLLLLILYKLHQTKEQLYLGRGLDDYIYTSGATLRRLGQVFSQPGQGVTTTVYNAELKQNPNETSAQGVKVKMFLAGEEEEPEV
jgi:hypothetical protein